jgi:hypothetical protein
MKYACLAFAGSLLRAPAPAQLADYGIQGMGAVSTRADEKRAPISPGGH